MERKAPVLRIEKISTQDGFGLRTVVFFKGCPLRCKWCSTPESQYTLKERYYQSVKCNLCLQCIHACPAEALSLSADGERVLWNADKCKRCFQCAAVCPTGATRVYGRDMTVAEIMKHIRRDEIFYFHSGGGVTLSGGDVLCYPDFCAALLAECRDLAINTTAELTMYGPYERIAKIMPHLDFALIDLKMIDSDQHEKWTGKRNEGILENICRASAEFTHIPFHFRVPLVWGVNDSEENIRQTAEFCSTIPNCTELEFLPYHRLGQETYRYLSREYELSELPTMTQEDALRKIMCLTGCKWPFRIKIAGAAVECADTGGAKNI